MTHIETVADALARGDIAAAEAAYAAERYGYRAEHVPATLQPTNGGADWRSAYTITPRQRAEEAISEWRYRNQKATTQRKAELERIGVAIIGSRTIPGASGPDSDVDVWHGPGVTDEGAALLASRWVAENCPGAKIDIVTRLTYVPGYPPQPIVLQGAIPPMRPADGRTAAIRAAGLALMGVAPRPDLPEAAWAPPEGTCDDLWSALRWARRHGVLDRLLDAPFPYDFGATSVAHSPEPRGGD